MRQWSGVKAADSKEASWSYLYVSQPVFERVSVASVQDLDQACAPSLADLIKEAESPQFTLKFDAPDRELTAGHVAAFIDESHFHRLPARYQKAVEQAVQLFHFFAGKEEIFIWASFFNRS